MNWASLRLAMRFVQLKGAHVFHRVIRCNDFCAGVILVEVRFNARCVDLVVCIILIQKGFNCSILHFRAWPDIHSVNQKWKSVEKPLFEILLDQDVVHTEAKGGSWRKVNEAIFQKQSGDHWNELLLRVLLSVGLAAVAVPRHVHSGLDKYASSKTEIEPRLIRHVLREVPSSYVNLDRQEKLLLLQFSLGDRHFSDLEGLELLPLSNGQFAKFEAQATTVYIASSEHPQELFAALDDRFLDKSVHEDIVRVLKEAVSQGTFLT